jgi:hypothetical protein
MLAESAKGRLKPLKSLKHRSPRGPQTPGSRIKPALKRFQPAFEDQLSLKKNNSGLAEGQLSLKKHESAMSKSWLKVN